MFFESCPAIFAEVETPLVGHASVFDGDFFFDDAHDSHGGDAAAGTFMRPPSTSARQEIERYRADDACDTEVELCHVRHYSGSEMGRRNKLAHRLRPRL